MGTSGYGEHVSLGYKTEDEPKCTHLILFHVIRQRQTTSELRNDLLVETFYRSQHLNVSTGGRHKVHDDTRPRIRGGHRGSNT